MTDEEREDAIKFFTEVSEKEVNNAKYSRLAIEALEQQPCDDCISRSDVKKYLSAPDANGDRVIYESDLDLLPSVTPKEKTGEWIRWYETIEQEHCTIHDPHCKCSECNQEYDPYIASLFNYCPNCGAKMIEPTGK